MKTTIAKRFDQLEPGDVIAGDDGYAIVVYNVVDNGPGACRDVWCVEADRAAKVRSMTHKSSELFAVECRDLTPAQQHADELLAYVREVESATIADRRCSARALLDKIDPPQPPTLAEALAAIESMRPMLDMQADNPSDRRARPVLELLDRARRSGVLK